MDETEEVSVIRVVVNHMKEGLGRVPTPQEVAEFLNKNELIQNDIRELVEKYLKQEIQ